MDLRRIKNIAMALGLVGAAGSMATAAPITFTGNVEADMPVTVGGGVTIVPGTAENAVAQASWSTAAGWITGWNIKDIRFSYDKASDTLYVGINTYSIAGNSTGNGTPGIPDPRQTAVGGVDPVGIGGQGLRFPSPSRPAVPTTTDARPPRLDRRRSRRQNSRRTRYGWFHRLDLRRLELGHCLQLWQHA